VKDVIIADDLLALFRRFVSAGEAELTILPLWVLHTHAFAGTCSFTPYLAITSPEKASGKTRTLEVLSAVAREPLITASISPAALARTVDISQPTLLLDEVDALLNGNREMAEAVRGLLNSGFNINGRYTRMVGTGANLKPAHFSTFCPKALAGIGQLPDTVADRSLTIRLKRVPRGQCESFRPDGQGKGAKALRQYLNDLKKRSAEWAQQNSQRLADSEPECPDEFLDRQRDISEPLLAIADLLGADWPYQARNALGKIFANPAARDKSKKIELLADIRKVFDGMDGDDRITTADLISKLTVEDSRWSEWNNGKAIKPYGLSRLLREFEIEPRTIYFSTHTAKGYMREWFFDAWRRYLPSDGLPDGSETALSTNVYACSDGVTANLGGTGE
jgi:hypothetical protein